MKLNKYMGLIALVGLAASANVSAALEQTNFHVLGFIQSQGDTGESRLFTPDGGWGAPSCPNAQVLQLPGTLQAGKSLLAIALTAKALGVPVQGVGECSTASPNFFVLKDLVFN